MSMRKRHQRIFACWLLACALISAGCAPDEGDPAAVVEQYLRAKVASDMNEMRGLLCAEMENLLERESRTFATVTNVEIQEMACERSGETTVSCSGTIVAAYGAENTEFPLTSYRVVREDDGWKWCGEA